MFFLLLKYNKLKRGIIKVTACTLSVLYKYVTFTFNELVFIEYVYNIFFSLDSNGRESRNAVAFLKLLKMISSTIVSRFFFCNQIIVIIIIIIIII